MLLTYVVAAGAVAVHADTTCVIELTCAVAAALTTTGNKSVIALTL